MQLRSGVTVAVAQVSSCSSNVTPSLGTSTCRKYSLKKQKKKKKKKKKKKRKVLRAKKFNYTYEFEWKYVRILIALVIWREFDFLFSIESAFSKIFL